MYILHKLHNITYTLLARFLRDCNHLQVHLVMQQLNITIM